MSIDFTALRRQFPLLSRKTYLNSGSYGALAERVRAAFEAYLEQRLRVGANWDQWVMKNEAVRGLTARLLHALPDEIAVTTSVSAGVNALATALDFPAQRNKVVISDFEFPTHAQIWYAQQPRGAQVVRVPCDAEGYIPAGQFAHYIDERTALVAITHVCYRNGARLDVAGIVRLARASGARVLLDCYQTAGSLDVDVRALDVDFAAGGMFKYLLGTAGIGFLYVRGSLIPALTPTSTGWFAQEDIGAMDITGNHPAHNARRFESGTPPVVNCYASEAGLELVLEVGVSAIEARVQSLTRQCMRELQGIGWPSVTPMPDARRGATVAIRSARVGELCAELARRDIVTSWRDDNLRASFHFYNNEDDIQALISALRELRGRYTPG